MEWLIRFIKRVVSNIVALVTICLFIGSVPMISIAVLVALEIDPRKYSDFLGWFIWSAFFVGIWYMFIASWTRFARAAYFGGNPRAGIFWAAGRHIGGTLLSFAAVITAIFVGRAILGSTEGLSDAASALYVREFAPVLLLASWSPVLVNLTRHFMRRYLVSGISAPSPVVGR